MAEVQVEVQGGRRADVKCSSSFSRCKSIVNKARKLLKGDFIVESIQNQITIR
jgi:translation initiation factor IF-1